MDLKILFDKGNLKYLLICLISLLIAIFFKVFSYLKPEVLLINNYLALFLVFGPALVVTILLIMIKILKSEHS